MDVTMIGLQNAGKTSLLRVLAVSSSVSLHENEELTILCSGRGVHGRVSDQVLVVIDYSTQSANHSL